MNVRDCVRCMLVCNERMPADERKQDVCYVVFVTRFSKCQKCGEVRIVFGRIFEYLCAVFWDMQPASFTLAMLSYANRACIHWKQGANFPVSHIYVIFSFVIYELLALATSIASMSMSEFHRTQERKSLNAIILHARAAAIERTPPDITLSLSTVLPLFELLFHIFIT